MAIIRFNPNHKIELAAEQDKKIERLRYVFWHPVRKFLLASDGFILAILDDVEIIEDDEKNSGMLHAISLDAIKEYARRWKKQKSDLLQMAINTETNEILEYDDENHSWTVVDRFKKPNPFGMEQIRAWDRLIDDHFFEISNGGTIVVKLDVNLLKRLADAISPLENKKRPSGEVVLNIYLPENIERLKGKTVSYHHAIVVSVDDYVGGKQKLKNAGLIMPGRIDEKIIVDIDSIY